MNAICPHCGFDLAKDEPVTEGRFRYDPRSGLFVDGKLLPLTPKEFELAGTLFRARGRTVPYQVLIDRLDTTDRNTIGVFKRRVLQKFNAAGLPNPIGAAHGVGLFWGGEPFAREPRA